MGLGLVGSEMYIRDRTVDDLVDFVVASMIDKLEVKQAIMPR